MGLVHIYCGDGKGKTSAAIGLAVRAAGSGRRVVIARFLKTDNSGEVEILKRLPEVTLIPCRKNFGFVRSMDEETKKSARIITEICFWRRQSWRKLRISWSLTRSWRR